MTMGTRVEYHFSKRRLRLRAIQRGPHGQQMQFQGFPSNSADSIDLCQSRIDHRRVYPSLRPEGEARRRNILAVRNNEWRSSNQDFWLGGYTLSALMPLVRRFTRTNRQLPSRQVHRAPSSLTSAPALAQNNDVPSPHPHFPPRTSNRTILIAQRSRSVISSPQLRLQGTPLV
ncbi:hypothetical protein K491DRAFT_234824 [Lophiostoma macrostomum CBS 122681]|uniref:Uncharacterized protein n=1 Tax=Lophiostoma macrostomum CBS 122681 TaxID=1314788 RepID=A0A6A6TIU3_9PLEO|nr:hypothetical protein K491DRAFT_234824 [Lophiostoma macrostomum CBS 122681]